jgi:hypothetical protein
MTGPVAQVAWRVKAKFGNVRVHAFSRKRVAQSVKEKPKGCVCA